MTARGRPKGLGSGAGKRRQTRRLAINASQRLILKDFELDDEGRVDGYAVGEKPE